MLWLSVDLSIGVAPFDVLGLSPEQGEALRQRASEMVGDDRRGHRTVNSDAIDNAIEARSFDDEEAQRTCLLEGLCASEIARAAGADELLVGSAAGLGGSYVLRLRLIDARRGVVAQEVEQTVEGGLLDLETALGEQIDRLLPRTSPWYRRWWPWTILGVAVAATAVALAIVFARPQTSPIDTYPLP